MTMKTVTPDTLAQLFTLVDGRLMRRHQIPITDKSGNPVIHLAPCGERVAVQGRTYAAKLIAHYLATGEWANRLPKAKRHRARVRVGAKLIHLGYFDSIAERDAAVFAYRMGIPSTENV